MLNKFLNHTLYIKIFPNRFQIRDVNQQTEYTAQAAQPFTTTRLLVGSFTHAEKALKDGLKSIPRGLFTPSPIIVIQPMAMVEGGLSEVEERAIRELAMSAGARKAFVTAGKELSDQDVLSIANR